MRGPKVVAIHQPNFFPWLGYFDKIVRSDVFILLDNVQFPKTGGTWINRVRIPINSQPAWITVPIVRSYHGVRNIADMEINNNLPWRKKMITAFQINYARAPYFDSVFPILQGLVRYPTISLCEFNVNAIKAIMALLRLDLDKLVLGSSLRARSRSTDLLIELVRAVGGSSYLCGGGAAGYLQEEKFSEAGLILCYQNFAHPVYVQNTMREFAPGLSIVDVLMNLGVDQTRQLLFGHTGN